MFTKNGGGDHKRRLSRLHYICTMHCVQCTLETQCTAHHVITVHYKDVIMSAMSPQFTSVSIIYQTICSGAGQRKHQSFASLAFVRGIHRWPMDSPHKGPVTRKNVLFDDAIIAFCEQGAVSIRKTVLPGMAIPMLKIRRPNGRLIFNMEIAIRR